MARAIGILIVVSGATMLTISETYYGNVTALLSIAYTNLLYFFEFATVTMVMVRLGVIAVHKVDKSY
jgi:hypothetical protein